jgi:S1-C subfamily serine protease
MTIGDVITAIDGKPVSSAPTLLLELSRYVAGDTVKVSIARPGGSSVLAITAADRPDPMDEALDRADPDKNAVPKLGIIGVDVPVKPIPPLRMPSGVLVAARTEVPAGHDVPLSPGDVIHALNGQPVRSLAELRSLLDSARGAVIVLQIERSDLLMFVTCVVE